MDAGRNRYFFPLTNLQIGDLQSYLSRLTLFLAPESNKFLILVDNQPWLIDRDARSAHLWQYMVTKSRHSPFANSRIKRRTKDSGRSHLKNASKSSPKKSEKFNRWFSLIDATLYHKRSLPVKKIKDSLLLNSDLHHTLYGFIVFEVSWDQVRGINYLNELQTDTSMALEAKSMKRWEFDSIKQASSCISSWFAGPSYERNLLQEYLDGVSVTGEVFYDAQEGTSAIDTSDVCDKPPNDFAAFENIPFYCNGLELKSSSFHTPPPSCGSYKRRKIMKSMSNGSESDGFSGESYSETVSSPRPSTSSSTSESESAVQSFEAAHYRDVLILFRFNDPDLPFELKKIIVSDLRLLTLLEYGLPSWVIFLQSYPVFCHLYRPWMCPLARLLYVLVSVTTVLIGFYDLYKNVPVLKATASRLCGPFFDWIESWEMISRIKYLGTMLFLHNFEKSVAWFLMITRAMKSLLSVFTKPVAGPILELAEFLLPSWNICIEIADMLGSIIFSVIGSTCSIVLSLGQIILWPWSILSFCWGIATSIIYPIFWILSEILIIPIRLVTASANFVGMTFSYTYYFLRDAWSSVGSLLKLASATEVTVDAYEVSLWRSLWNDLFSQVFRAIRSILYGFIAFFTACNRHRLSLYNHLRDFFLRLSCTTSRLRLADSSIGLHEQRPQSPLGRVRSHRKHPSKYKKKLA